MIALPLCGRRTAKVPEKDVRMTLRQLQYIDTIAKKGSLTAAAQALFVSQPSLTASLHELEAELGITIFVRSRKGISLTPEGETFLGYARQILDQVSLVEEHYSGTETVRRHFCVSSQHYSFAVEAFVALLREYGGPRYEFHMRETQTYDIIRDVAAVRSEIGVLYLNRFNEAVLRRTLAENGLVFTRLFRASPHVFLGAGNPLAKKKAVTMDDLRAYPRLSYEQGEHNSFYFAEEMQSTVESEREIVVCDRATLFNLLIGMNGYTICSGVINADLNGTEIVSRPLLVDDYMDVGYILPKDQKTGELTAAYIQNLLCYTQNAEI